MSLPLTRRIARAALLVAAGATPLVGAAGSASAAQLPGPTGVGGPSTPDATELGETVENAVELSSPATKSEGNKTQKTVKKTKKTMKATHKVVDDAGESAGEAVTGTPLRTDSLHHLELPGAESLSREVGELSTPKALPQTAALPTMERVPHLGGLPVGNLPSMDQHLAPTTLPATGGQPAGAFGPGGAAGLLPHSGALPDGAVSPLTSTLPSPETDDYTVMDGDLLTGAAQALPQGSVAGMQLPDRSSLPG